LRGKNAGMFRETEKFSDDERAMFAALPEDTRRALRYMQLMDRMKNGEMMLLMPFDIRIK
jgi:hypothetical protein